jgi:hypothetical protein
MFIFTFDDARWPAVLMEGARQDEHGVYQLGRWDDAWWVVRGKNLVLCASETAARLYQNGDYARLADSPGYRTAQKAAGDSLVWAWSPLPTWLDIVRTQAAPQERARFDQAVQTLGLQHFTGALLTSSITRRSLEFRLTLTTDGQKQGLLAALPEGAPKMVSDVPANASAAVVEHWGNPQETMGHVLDLVLQLEKQFSPQNPTLAMGMSSASQMLGVESIDQFLGQLGTGIAAYLPHPGPDAMLDRDDWIVSMELADVGAFRGSLKNMAMNLFGREFPTMEHNGLTLMQVPNPGQVPILMAVQDERFVLGMNAARIKGHLDWLRDPARAVLPPREAGTMEMGILDLGLLFSSYPQPESGPILSWNFRREGDNLVAVMRIESEQALPPLAFYSPAAVPLLAAMLMPALSRARAAARTAADQNNLRAIGTAVLQYRRQHDRYPPNLKSLVDAGIIEDAEVLVSPMDDNPPTVNGLKTSYVYIGGPLPLDLPHETPICYTRSGVVPGERNVLFADMVVRAAHGDNFQRIQPRTAYQQLVTALGKEATDERKAELREFFGIDE